MIQYRLNRPFLAALSAILRGLRMATYLACLLLVTGVPVVWILVELVPLGPLFGFTVLFVAPATTLVILFAPRLLLSSVTGAPTRMKALLVDFFGYLQSKVTDNCGKTHLPKWLIVLGCLLLVVIPAVSLLSMFSERSHRTSDATAALQSFELIYSSGTDDPGIQRTLAELERARRQLDGQWPTSTNSQPIALYLFRDAEDFRTQLQLGDWSGGATYCSDTGPSIGVPLEAASSWLSELPASRTPMHEMVHAMICQSLGRQAFHSIPRWFHEGMAQLFDGEGSSQSWERVLNRSFVWREREELMGPELFCGYHAKGPASETLPFYSTAWEFLRVLDARKGRSALNGVVEDIASGVAFENSFRSRFGGTCKELYGKWSQSLWP